MAYPKHPGNSLRSTGFVADTSVLILPLLFNYFDTEKIDEQVKTRMINQIVATEYRSVPRLQEQCREYFESRLPVVIVPQVISEINGHAQARGDGKGKLGLTGDSYERFWSHAFGYLNRYVEEEFVSLNEIFADTDLRQIACRIGPVDALLITAARRRSLPVLTMDRRTLIQEAKALNVAAIHLGDILLWE